MHFNLQHLALDFRLTLAAPLVLQAFITSFHFYPGAFSLVITRACKQTLKCHLTRLLNGRNLVTLVVSWLMPIDYR